jgi:hypothetical protein
MANTTISREDEQAMIEMVRKPKRTRAFKEDYVKRCAVMEMENHALKCEVERLKKDGGKDCHGGQLIVVYFIGMAIGLAMGIYGKAVMR